jgi:hypothetical protein
MLCIHTQFDQHNTTENVPTYQLLLARVKPRCLANMYREPTDITDQSEG